MEREAMNVFSRMVNGRVAQVEAEIALEEILGVGLLGIAFDDYDGSFEIYPDRDSEVYPTPEQHEQIMALGCSRYWINYSDDTERYGHADGCGDRKKVSGIGGRWARHNEGKEWRRKQEEEQAALRIDAERYMHLRRLLALAADAIPNRSDGVNDELLDAIFEALQ